MRIARGPGAEVIAHRGASMQHPEHTIDAFDAALELGADTLELDLRATADGHVVVLHDPTLVRTHGDPRAVASLRRTQLPASVLTLAGVLARYAGRTGLLLELKAPNAPVDAVVAQAASVHGVVLQSFDRAALQRAVRGAPGLAVAPLYRRRPTTRQLDRAAIRAEGVGVAHELVDAALVGAVHARGLRLRAYTANAPEELRRLAGLGVDGLITDAPERALDAAAGVAAAATAAAA